MRKSKYTQAKKDANTQGKMQRQFGKLQIGNCKWETANKELQRWKSIVDNKQK